MKTNNKLALLAAASLLFIGAVDAREVDVTFDPADWDGSPGANTFWHIAVSGNVFVYFAEAEDECVVTRMMVTSESKTLDDPDDIYPLEVDDRLIVVEDVEWIQEDCEGDWVLAERTWDWYAHDDDGNIWYFGEYTEAYEDGECSLGGSWEAGTDGATPGIVMLAAPRVGDSYQQEYLEHKAEDWGKVLKLNESVSIDEGDHYYCLKTKEWTPLERGHVEHKFYCEASAPGLVYIKELHGKTVHVEYIGSTLPDRVDYPPEQVFPDELCDD